MTREEAIQELQNCIELIRQDGQDYIDERDIPLLNMAIEALTDQPTGEWVRAHVGTIAEGYYCSRCGNNGYQTDFCHSCGARMKGGVK